MYLLNLPKKMSTTRGNRELAQMTEVRLVHGCISYEKLYCAVYVPGPFDATGWLRHEDLPPLRIQDPWCAVDFAD